MNTNWHCIDMDGVEICRNGEHFTMPQPKDQSYEDYVFECWVFCGFMNMMEMKISIEDYIERYYYKKLKRVR